ncbi:hypothetical protein K6K41_05250 [Chenggangzhangella methanolivorans]|uniref:Fic/DOC N-terminal domain-containing protein n=1 Tax=Chenggangzhangella methanolivorans TaxID=1437009 RepID=A0A9E6RA53_9HYPH|nr:hypothetical protein K6K41_05250 [Chenggangzhangella methanolivorans]
MDKTAFGSSPAGSLAPTIGGQFAFVPHDLPPELDLSALLVPLTQATQALGQLNGVMTTLPDPYLLIRPLEAREALTSSSMEGTYTTVDALLLAEAGFEGARQTADTREVHNYARALRNAIKSLDELPLCLRTIKSAHADLLKGVGRGRGAAAEAGEFKSSQNWIGSASIKNARFVPPPPRSLAIGCMRSNSIFSGKTARRFPRCSTQRSSTISSRPFIRSPTATDASAAFLSRSSWSTGRRSVIRRCS